MGLLQRNSQASSRPRRCGRPTTCGRSCPCQSCPRPTTFQSGFRPLLACSVQFPPGLSHFSHLCVFVQARAWLCTRVLPFSQTTAELEALQKDRERRAGKRPPFFFATRCFLPLQEMNNFLSPPAIFCLRPPKSPLLTLNPGHILVSFLFFRRCKNKKAWLFFCSGISFFLLPVTFLPHILILTEKETFGDGEKCQNLCVKALSGGVLRKFGNNTYIFMSGDQTDEHILAKC